jgi:hypothetical protein
MITFSRMIKNIGLQFTDRVFDRAELSAIRRRMSEESEKLLASLPFGPSSTFTGVLLLKSYAGMNGIVMHTGDSLLFRCDLQARIAGQVTDSNFWMVGRSKRFFQIDEIPVDNATTLILATDGLDGIAFAPGCSREEFVLNLAEEFSPDDLPDGLFSTEESCPVGRDDVAIIAIHPYAELGFCGSVIIGGTSGQEEVTYEKERRSGCIPDRYEPVHRFDGYVGFPESLFLM